MYLLNYIALQRGSTQSKETAQYIQLYIHQYIHQYIHLYIHQYIHLYIHLYIHTQAARKGKHFL